MFKLVLNTCKQIRNICYLVLGASLSANVGGDIIQKLHLHSLSYFFRRVTAGSLKFVTWHPKLLITEDLEAKGKADELAPLHPDS